MGATYSYATKTEFLRRVYRAASAASESARNTYLDGLADTALDAAARGSAMSSVAIGGHSTGYSLFNGWDPQVTLDLIAWARDYISEATATAAVATVLRPVRQFRVSLQSIRLEGA